MKLWLARRHWDRFARTDPLWAILTDPEKRGNRWALDEFFATGRNDVDRDLARIRAACPGLPRGHALDFGCGVGRLTQALPDHFDRVTGVDISSDMLALAERHNRWGERVRYLHNSRPDLGLIADGSVDFVISLITLQHIAPGHAKSYIAEFLRVLAPGGAAFFQVLHRSNLTSRLSFYPPSLAKKLRRYLNRFAVWEPAMDMTIIPRSDLMAVLHACGAEVLSAGPRDDAGSDYESQAYLVRKPFAKPTVPLEVATGG